MYVSTIFLYNLTSREVFTKCEILVRDIWRRIWGQFLHVLWGIGTNSSQCEIYEVRNLRFIGAAWTGSTLFTYGNMITYDPTLVDLVSYAFILCTNMNLYS